MEEKAPRFLILAGEESRDSSAGNVKIQVGRSMENIAVVDPSPFSLVFHLKAK